MRTEIAYNQLPTKTTPSVENDTVLILDSEDGNIVKQQSALQFRGPEGIQGEKGEKGETGEKGDTGPKGEPGEKGDNGDKGEKGDTIQGIARISGNGSPGTIDTYRIAMSNGTHFDFQVTNGANGVGTLQSIRVDGSLLSIDNTDAANPVFSLDDKILTSDDIVNNLTSTDTNKPLSANQGKELKRLIDSKTDIVLPDDNLTESNITHKNITVDTLNVTRNNGSSASVFLKNTSRNGKIYEFFSDGFGDFGIYNQSNRSNIFRLNQNAATFYQGVNMNSQKIYHLGEPTEDNDAANKKYVDDGLAHKVNTEPGKGLSTNDFTDEYKEKIENSGGGIEKEYVLGEDITGNLTPVIVHKNTTIKQAILPEMDSNSIVVGGETITVSNKNATKRTNDTTIALDSSSNHWTVNMGKKRKIVGIEINAKLNNSSNLIKIEYGNDGSQWALAKTIDHTSLSISYSNLFVHISLDFEAQYIKLSGKRYYVDLRYCQIFEEVIYDGIYKVNPHIPGLARTDGFVFKNLNKNDTTTVALLGQNSNVSGFSSVANSPVFVDDDGRITTTPSIRGLGIVRDGILSVDTIQHFGAIGTLLEFGHDSDNTKQNTIITSGNIAINEGRYMWKISDNINYSLSSWYGNYELQYSVDGNTWVAIKSIPFQSNSRRNNEEHTFTIPSGLVRVCIHEKDQSNYTYNIKTSLTTHLG